MTKDTKPHHDSMADVEQALTKTEQFFEKNLNTVIYSIAGLIIVIVAFLAFQKYSVEPKEQSAQIDMFGAQNYFAKDSFNLAINGDGSVFGFLDIIEEYGSTPAGNLANYYTGISYLHLGEYNEAISYLKDFDTDDLLLLPIKDAAIGDAYVELGEYSDAISYYKKALAVNDNKLTTPGVKIKLGLAYEAEGSADKAIEQYIELKDQFPASTEVASAEKYIARLQQK